jgi:hypothetical protein
MHVLSEQSHQVVSPSSPVVDRWITEPAERVEDAMHVAFDAGTVLDLGSAGELHLDGPFTAVSAEGRAAWRAPARLVYRGASILRFTRVDVEVIAWSESLTEVTVRSSGRRVVTWGERRERRYFEQAHRAATRVAGVLATADLRAA